MHCARGKLAGQRVRLSSRSCDLAAGFIDSLTVKDCREHDVINDNGRDRLATHQK